MDCSPEGSSFYGIFQARILEWVAISYSRDLPNPGIEPVSPALQAYFFLLRFSGLWQDKPICASIFSLGLLPCVFLYPLFLQGYLSVDIVQFNHSVMSDSLWPHGLQHTRLPVHHQLLEPTQTHVHQIGDAIQPSHPLSSPSPPAFILSQHQVFSNESVLHIRWPKYWSFSCSISPSNEYSGLISFRIDWLDLLAVQGTLKSLLPTVQKHQFFGAQHSLQSNSHINTWLLEKP